MLDLVSTWTADTVAVRDVDGEVRVEAPSFRVAAEVLAGQEALSGGDTEGWVVIREACERWLPQPLYAELFEREGQDPGEVAKAVVQMLSAGVADEEKHEEREEEAKAEARRTSWQRLFADYRAFFGESHEEVLRTAWPLWLAQFEQVSALRAREQLRNAAWYGGAKTGKLDDVIERADFHELPADEVAPGVYVPPWERADLTKEEWTQQKVQEAFAVKRRWLSDAEAQA